MASQNAKWGSNMLHVYTDFPTDNQLQLGLNAIGCEGIEEVGPKCAVSPIKPCHVSLVPPMGQNRFRPQGFGGTTACGLRSKGAPQAQCARSATIWVSGRTRDPYFEILGAPRGIMVTPSGGFDF